MKLKKKHLSSFEDNGFVIIKKLLSKKDISSIFNQLNDTLSVILKFNKIKFKEKISLDEKYLLLSKKIPILKSHFYDSIKMLDSLNSLVFSKMGGRISLNPYRAKILCALFSTHCHFSISLGSISLTPRIACIFICCRMPYFLRMHMEVNQLVKNFHVLQ